MPFEKIVLLAGKWDTTPLVYHFLNNRFGVEKAVLEDGVPRKEFLKKRARKMGWVKVGGQVLFQLLIGKTLTRLSAARIDEIKQQYGLASQPIPQGEAIYVPSVNSESCLEQLKRLQPDLVIVHGTRIISKKLLQQVDAPFINIHAGITPLYRGSHGAYWALANGDAENCGVTVHLVDAGIDTGNILAQGKIPYGPRDNFATYPYLQLAEGLKLLASVIEKMEKGERPVVKNSLGSGLWHHPTLWGYLWKRVSRGVR